MTQSSEITDEMDGRDTAIVRVELAAPIVESITSFKCAGVAFAPVNASPHRRFPITANVTNTTLTDAAPAHHSFLYIRGTSLKRARYGMTTVFVACALLMGCATQNSPLKHGNMSRRLRRPYRFAYS